MEQRLIDANKVMDKMRNTFDMQELYLPIHFKELITDELPTVEAIPRERIEQIVAEILMKDFDRVTCGEDTLTPQDCVAIIRKYTKEPNNELPK